MSSNKNFCRPISPTIQIHPTLGCNLYCSHCYSDSGPSAKTKLDVKIVLEVITDAAKMGYKIVSISGGEPLMYDGLDKILKHAKSYNMTTTVTTNGTLLDNKRLTELEKYLDLMAISLDGPPTIHNEMRGSPNAFKLLLLGLKNLKNSNLSFGFIHTLTQKSWQHLLWIAEFAAQNNASLLQIHPLELVGRANDNLRSSWANDDILTRGYLLAFVLAARYTDSMKIQFDAFHRERVMQNPELIYASDLKIDLENSKPSDLLSDLVVEADGTVVPISYGLSKKFALCNINQSRLSEIWPHYLQKGGYEKFRKLCQKVFKEISMPNDLPLFNWYELMVSSSYN